MICLPSIEQLSSKPHEYRVRFLGDVLVAVGFVSDELACFVHRRLDEWIGVVEVVGDDDSTLLESIGIGNVP